MWQVYGWVLVEKVVGFEYEFGVFYWYDWEVFGFVDVGVVEGVLDDEIFVLDVVVLLYVFGQVVFVGMLVGVVV